MSYADLPRKPFQWQQLFPLFDKLPLWAGYLFAILCSLGMGYSLGSARSMFPDPRQDKIMLIALAAGALLVIFFSGSETTQRRASPRATRGTAETQ